MIDSVYGAATVIGCVLGATGILTGGVVSVFKKPKAPNTTVSTERFLRVEHRLESFEKEACRIKDEMIANRIRHDEVVDGIYSEISKLRELVIETIKHR